MNEAWNPGLRSEIPSSLQPSITLFRPENAFVDHVEAKELSDLCGLNVLELVALRPERLAVHALLIRVTADLSVADGPSYEELGINLRGMVATLHERYLAPEMQGIAAAFEVEMERASAFIDAELRSGIFGEGDAEAVREAPDAEGGIRGRIARLFGAGTNAGHAGAADATGASARESGCAELAAVTRWQQRSDASDESFERACLGALARVVGGIVAHRGRLVVDRGLIVRLAVRQVGNVHGAGLVAGRVEPLLRTAVDAEGWRFLPAQPKPVIMNVKGASASGKSTIRPQQRELAGKLGIPWEDFALISPDYWRKYLLDYESLGDDHKYAAMLTGQELAMIDAGLDRYMAAKAAAGRMSHLLIDRFRFDSFSLDGGRSSDSRLLSRFGDRVFMFFMVTPPAETVVRAWKRGSSTGRYKAVDDLLHHNVEAFTGMPALFLSWVKSTDKRVHFEFLDNDVPEGELPRTAAFGWNDCMTILDLDMMLNIERYRKVDVEASAPDGIFASADLSVAANTGFIDRCVETIPDVAFADRETGGVYSRTRAGKLVAVNRAAIDRRADRERVETVLARFGYPDIDESGNGDDENGQPGNGDRENGECGGQAGDAIDVAQEKRFTFGQWG